jgi:hypothetical protein
VQRMLAGAGDVRRPLRWSASTLLAHLRHMQRAYAARPALRAAMPAARRSVADIADHFWSSSAQRCKNRFC